LVRVAACTPHSPLLEIGESAARDGGPIARAARVRPTTNRDPRRTFRGEHGDPGIELGKLQTPSKAAESGRHDGLVLPWARWWASHGSELKEALEATPKKKVDGWLNERSAHSKVPPAILRQNKRNKYGMTRRDGKGDIRRPTAPLF